MRWNSFTTPQWKERDWPAYKLAERLRWTASHISRSEAGKRRVTDVDVGHYLGMCGAGDDVLQDLLELVNEPDDFRLQRHQGRIPDQLRSLTFHEATAAQIQCFEPIYIPGVFQTADYARAILAAGPDTMEDELEQMVAARIERQAILDRPRPPVLLAVLDEAVLHRCVGSPKIMHEQLLHLADLSDRPRITIQVVPARVGVHAGLLGGFAIASVDGAADIVYLETSADGQVAEKSSVVAQVTRRFDTLRAVALPKDDSRDLILKVAEERWSST